MQYSNFNMKNNVHATLSTAVSSVATTIQLTSWQWSRFWTTFPQIATLESFDENWKVIKREIVKITWRSGDNLTVVRAFAPCPENDDANSQTQSAISFNADDTISLYIPKEIFDKISDSLNDIYDNGTNNLRTELVSWLEVEVNAWSVLVWSAYYDFAGWTITLTDNATNYLEIDEDWNLANNTSDWNEENTKLAIITTSGWSVTNIKDRRLWTIGWKIGGVNIHDLTEKITLALDDEFIVSDSEAIFQNKKIKANTISKAIWNDNKLNIDFVLISGWWAWWRWYITNGASGGWWWWQLIEWKAVLNRWWEYSFIIWSWWQTNSESGGWSLFLWYFCYWWWWWAWSWAWNPWWNWWWWSFRWVSDTWYAGNNYHPTNVSYSWWNWVANTFAWWWGGWMWWNWWNSTWSGWWAWWAWKISAITWTSIEYCKWWVWWSYYQWSSWIDWTNYWDWWWWTWYSAWSGATWWKWKGGALIISYPETNNFAITGATTSFVAWWNQIHIFETSWTLVVN